MVDTVRIPPGSSATTQRGHR
uniref:Uncharacterized protein n=1 Tax=Anguilla anguilla TaxID=7936 RepID=A0A0E9QF62_ANGAN